VYILHYDEYRVTRAHRLYISIIRENKTLNFIRVALILFIRRFTSFALVDLQYTNHRV